MELSNKKYAQKDYWDERYKEEESFDWFGTYDNFKHIIRAKIPDKNSKILMLGCGNSTLGVDMYNDGYHFITNTDYSGPVIEAMANKCQDLKEMTWIEMDMRSLRFPPESFDVVLEKGTLDAILVEEEDVWVMSDKSEETLDHIMQQICHVLKPDGCFISITFAQPHFRKKHYARDHYGWAVDIQLYGETFHYFFYTMMKGRPLCSDDAQLWEKYQRGKREGRERKETTLVECAEQTYDDVVQDIFMLNADIL